MRIPGRLNRRGSVGIVAAIAGVMLLCLGGTAIDLERMWLVRGRLQTSLDAAGLAAARTYAASNCTTTCTNPNAAALFWADFGRNNDINATGGTGFMSATATTPVFTPVDPTHNKITASATVPTIMLGLLSFYAGINPTPQVTMTVSTVALRNGTGLELALVLDTTRSMGFTDSSTGGTKLASLQSAVQAMMSSLYGTDINGNPNDTLQNLWVSVVPFATAVNVGSSHTNWLSNYSPSSFGNYNWGGCLEARAAPYDQSEDNPYTQPFAPYLFASTYNQWGSSNTNSSLNGQPNCNYYGYNNVYGRGYAPHYSNYVCEGDNDWGAPNVSANAAYTSSTSPPSTNDSTFNFGPNNGCGTATVLPLTASRTAVMNAVNGLTTFHSLGTIIGLGMQAGWFTLSPSWSGLWGTANSPLPYNTPAMQKAVVLVSDGGSTWGYDPIYAPMTQRIDAFYMPYGRLNENRLGISFTTSSDLYSDEVATANTADVELSRRWVATCSNMKAKGITIFVVGLGVANSTDRGNLESCASGTSGSNVNTYYFESPDAATLANAMQGVTSQLTSLSLTQ